MSKKRNDFSNNCLFNLWNVKLVLSYWHFIISIFHYAQISLWKKLFAWVKKERADHSKKLTMSLKHFGESIVPIMVEYHAMSIKI